MKKTIKLFLAVAILMIPLSQLSGTDLGLDVKGTETFKLNHDVSKPELKFKSTAPLEDIEGYVVSDHITSSVMFDPGNVESASGEVVFKVAGMRTGIDVRDEHLRSSDWLNAEKHPEVTFKLNSLKDVESIESKGIRATAKAIAVGEFTMHRESKEMQIPVKITFLKESEATAKRAPGHLFFVEGSFKVALKDFKVKGSKGVVGSKVGEEIDVNFKLYYNSI